MAPRFAHWGVVRVGALAAYFAALVVWSAEYGVPVQRELVMLWVCGALVCASLGRSPRQIVQLALDWLPIAAVLLAYDFTRGAADSLGTGVHALPMIHFDEFVFGGCVHAQVVPGAEQPGRAAGDPVGQVGGVLRGGVGGRVAEAALVEIEAPG